MHVFEDMTLGSELLLFVGIVILLTFALLVIQWIVEKREEMEKSLR